jgi:hypothetical protein
MYGCRQQIKLMAKIKPGLCLILHPSGGPPATFAARASSVRYRAGRGTIHLPNFELPRLAFSLGEVLKMKSARCAATVITMFAATTALAQPYDPKAIYYSDSVLNKAMENIAQMQEPELRAFTHLPSRMHGRRNRSRK